MAHLVETMAYVNATPWHGLGNPLTENQPLKIWLREAGMDWGILDNPVLYRSAEGLQSFADNKVLYRSDTLAPLSVVSKRYQVVQPREVLEFYRDLVDLGGFQLETAGVLKGGKKLWALARTGQETLLKGNDQVKAYLLLATACDGTLATTAQFTSVRVVCNNTLHIALGDNTGAVKVSHRSSFDADAVKRQLGIAVSSWDSFMVRMKALSERKISDAQAEALLTKVLTLPQHPQAPLKPVQAVLELFQGKGKGSDLSSAKGTAWGLVNAVTEYADHSKRARSNDHRLDSAWFGPGAQLKQAAWTEALKLVS